MHNHRGISNNYKFLLIWYIIFNFAVSLMVGTILGACTGPQVKDETEKIVTIAEDVCVEIEKEIPNDWVTLACVAEDGITRLLVRMPRGEWIRVRRMTVRTLEKP